MFLMRLYASYQGSKLGARHTYSSHHSWNRLVVHTVLVMICCFYTSEIRPFATLYVKISLIECVITHSSDPCESAIECWPER